MHILQIFNTVKIFLLVSLSLSWVLAQDSDHDGLLDHWETNGIGPINPSIHNVDPNRADMFVIFSFRNRSAVNMADVRLHIDRLKALYRNIPLINPDGSRGINIIELSGPDIPSNQANVPYFDLYNFMCAEEWRCYSHVYLIEPGAGGGGQTWGRVSGGGYDWHIMAHELGHQLALNHEPPNSQTGPLFPSLMSYDFTYSLGGDPEAVGFSNGKFLSVELSESNANEVLNFNYNDLKYLEQGPYFYKVESLNETQTSVDWNRNGICCESSVRSDINEGDAVVVGPTQHLSYSSGSITMSNLNNKLFLFFPKIPTVPTVNWNLFFDKPMPHSLYYQFLNKNNVVSSNKLLTADDVFGDPSSFTNSNSHIAVAYPTKGLNPKITNYLVEGSGEISSVSSITDNTLKVDQVILTGNPPIIEVVQVKEKASAYQAAYKQKNNKLWMFTWAAKDSSIFCKQVFINAKGHLSLGALIQLKDDKLKALKSESRIGATYNPYTKKLILITKEQVNFTRHRMKINYFSWKNNTWVFETSEWIGLPNSTITSNTTPSIIIEKGGSISIYCKGNVSLNSNSQLFRIRPVANNGFDGGWLVKMIRDVWTTTRSAPAFCLWQDDIAMAMRWCQPEGQFAMEMNNRIVYVAKASGISETPLKDFDEVEYIRTKGLSDFICK